MPKYLVNLAFKVSTAIVVEADFGPEAGLIAKETVEESTEDVENSIYSAIADCATLPEIDNIIISSVEEL